MVSGTGLPGVEQPIGSRVILHVDNDCFYAACERQRDSSLDGEPVVVGMGFEPDTTDGVVATASYEAREFGIESAMPISEAVDRLPPRSQVASDTEPTGIYRPVDMTFYQSQAADVRAVLADHADVLRTVSIDEAYLDCTAQVSWTDAESFAQSLKRTIQAECSLPVSIGVAPSMSVAKIASDIDKPDGLVVVPPNCVESFLAPLSIDALHGVGPKTAHALRSEGIETVGDLANRPVDMIASQFGDRGRDLHQRARGIDRRPVTPRGDPKSLSRESAFGAPTDTFEEIRTQVETLARAVADRARSRGATYRTIGIKVVEPPFEISTRETSLPGPVDDPEIVVRRAIDLLTEFEGTSVRKVGVRVANLSFADGEQVDLDAWDGEDTTDGVTVSDETGPYRGQTRLTNFDH